MTRLDVVEQPKEWFGEPADTLWVAFVNTLVMKTEGEVFDRLTSGPATGRWAATIGIGSQAAFERRWADTSEGNLAVIMQHRSRLRSAIEKGDGASERRRTLAEVATEMLQTTPVWLRCEGEQLQIGIEDPTLKVVLPLMGHSLGRFVQSGDPERIRQCRSDDCILYFVDETRPGNRRWCDGATCGNRDRVRRHAERAGKRLASERPR